MRRDELLQKPLLEGLAANKEDLERLCADFINAPQKATPSSSESPLLATDLKFIPPNSASIKVTTHRIPFDHQSVILVMLANCHSDGEIEAGINEIKTVRPDDLGCYNLYPRQIRRWRASRLKTAAKRGVRVDTEFEDEIYATLCITEATTIFIQDEKTDELVEHVKIRIKQSILFSYGMVVTAAQEVRQNQSIQRIKVYKSLSFPISGY